MERTDFGQELAAIFTDRGFVIKHKGLSLEAFWIPIKRRMCQYLQKNTENFRHIIYVNYDLLLSPREELFNVLTKK